VLLIDDEMTASALATAVRCASCRRLVPVWISGTDPCDC
jgi:hypothetical protein